MSRFPCLRARVLLCLASVHPGFNILGAASDAFEGRIDTELVRGTETTALEYRIAANQMRIAIVGSDWPHPIDIVDLKSGELLLLFPHNQTYMRLKSGEGGAAVPPIRQGAPSAAISLPGTIGSTPAVPPSVAMPNPMPLMPKLPAGLPPGIGPQPGSRPGMILIPPMPPLNFEARPQLTATDDKKEILGFPCVRYELKQRGETLEVWATDQLLPYHAYVRSQPPRFGPRMIEDEWPLMLRERKLFPLAVSLHYDDGPELFHFQVKGLKAEKITDADAHLFQPPENYTGIQPLPN